MRDGIPIHVTVQPPAYSPIEDARRLLAPGLLTRVQARIRRPELDAAIAAGADPTSSPLLAARAAQLVTRGSRIRIASGLERVASAADGSGRRYAVLPPRSAIRRNRAELMDLSVILCQDRPAYAQGVAMLKRVIADATSPVYSDRSGDVLAARLRLARRRLAG